MKNIINKLKSKKIKDEIIRMLISAVVMLILAAILDISEITYGDVLMITGLTILTSLFGTASGIVCAVIVMGNSLLFSEMSHSIFNHNIEGLQYIFIIAADVILSVIFIGHLNKKQKGTYNELNHTNELLKKDNAKLQEESSIDALTGIKNRAALRAEYDSYENCDIHVMMLDIDDFKQLNDSLGHESGDTILSSVGKALIETFGQKHCYRFGGDEFLIIFADIKEKYFVRMVEELKERITSIKGRDGNAVRFSVGYVYGETKLPKDIRLMMRQADSNLYKAKYFGKNKCVSSEYSRHIAENIKKMNLSKEKNLSDL